MAWGIDRNGLAERGWLPVAIERAIKTARSPSDFAIKEAAHAHAALRAAGYAIVPVEPTEAMINAAAYGSKEDRPIIAFRLKHGIAAAEDTGQ